MEKLHYAHDDLSNYLGKYNELMQNYIKTFIETAHEINGLLKDIDETMAQSLEGINAYSLTEVDFSNTNIASAIKECADDLSAYVEDEGGSELLDFMYPAPMLNYIETLNSMTSFLQTVWHIVNNAADMTETDWDEVAWVLDKFVNVVR